MANKYLSLSSHSTWKACNLSVSLSCSTTLSVALRFFSGDFHSNDTEQREGLGGRKDVLYYLACLWREFTSQVGREIRSGWVCGWGGGGAVISARKGTACCVAPGRTGIGTTRRKGRRHGTPSRNRRRRVASESRFRNTVKLGPWELEVEVEQTALKYCTRTQVTYTLQLNTVVTPPERVLNLVL